MTARTCVECGLTLDLSRFVPRHSSEYERLPAMGEIWRQPRCRDCNKLYLRRRALFLGRIAELARRHDVVVRPRPRSAYRIVEVEESASARRASRALRTVARAFNASLPDDRCEVERHGITVRSMPVAVSRAMQQTFFGLDEPPAR